MSAAAPGLHQALTVERICQRLARFEPGRRRAPQDPLLAGLPELCRGDHDLNPDMQPKVPLVPAAVLVPLVHYETRITILLTERTAHLPDHAGQVSFPGGRIDEADRDAVAAALREAEEEIGLDPALVRPIGRLDTYVTRTGYEVSPVVALVQPPTQLRANPKEVAHIFEVPLDFVVDPVNHRLGRRVYQGTERFFYEMPWGEHYIWGATAGMLVNLSEILRGDI